MARVAKPASTPDGMSLVALAPFPAFNPLNWWALASPVNAMRAACHNTHMALDAWRAGADAMRAMLREQQDTMLALMERPDSVKRDSLEPETTKREEADSAAVAAEFVHPMLEVTRAYGRIGKAFIVAQRDTMRAFAGQADRPH